MRARVLLSCRKVRRQKAEGRRQKICSLSSVFSPLRSGFTLIEAILTMAILAGGIVGVMTLYQQNIARSDESEQTWIATQLAQEKLEQMIQDKKYQQYAFIIAANYPSPENLSLQGFPGYTRTTTIQEVRGTDLITSQNGSGYKRITVRVQATGGVNVILETLVTFWGEL